MINKYLICTIFSLITAVNLHSQELLRLTIEEAIDLARRQSPSVVAAKHSFHSAYWSYRNFKANYLPSMSFSTTPRFNHWINAITMPDGTTQFVQQNQFAVDGNFSLSQNIALTGGRFSLSTGINRLDMFGVSNSHSYNTNPVSVSYQQTLWGHNGLKWSRKTEPLRYEYAKKNYITTLEDVSISVISMFFGLAMAQSNLDMAISNYQKFDTLYAFTEGRYKIGRMSENEMLQWEVRRLNEEINLQNARVYLEDNLQSFRTYLGIKDTIPIEAVTSKIIPSLNVDPYKALELALENNPTVIRMKLSEIESESNVAYSKANSGLQANLHAQLGLSQTSENFRTAYKDPLNQQYAQIGISIPILDWGQGKGRVKVAESNRRLTEIQLEQERISFEQSILRLVRQFNLQRNQVSIAEKTDYMANKRNEVAQRLYMLGRSTILELNSAISEKDAAKRNYINILQSFWSYYYNLRRYTLYDFEKNMLLSEDYESLLK
ncbi:MAG: TolC family protein [Bacteroidales bacterium]|jgi:outer membrane protein TolC|nr:TolC family protein [Bacteroidales bacterium]